VASKNFKNYEFKLGKLGMVLFISGMSLLLFAVFALGVFVGKDLDTMPGKIASDVPGTVKEKLGLASEAKPESKEGARNAAVDRQPEFNWTFYDTLGKKKGEERGIISERDKDKSLSGEAAGKSRSAAVAKLVPAAAGTTAGKKNADADKSDKKDSRTSSAAKQQAKTAETKKEQPRVASTTAKALQAKGFVVADVGKTDRKTAAPKAGPVQTTEKQEKQEKKADTTGTFFVQVVSYQEKGKSELAAKKVKFLGYKPKIVPVDLAAKGKWYRVIVDGFETKEKAQKAAAKIKAQLKGTQGIVRANTPVQKASR